MNKSIKLMLAGATSLLLACSPIKPTVTNQYKLDSYSEKRLAGKFTSQSILITPPEAVTGYQTEQMLYIRKHFELSSFAQNSWIGPPADMLFPLIVQSVQRSGFFRAVSSSPGQEQTDYRLDTQLIELQQDFLKTPSEIKLTVKIVLTNVHDGRVVASRVIQQRVKCPFESPYGGVLAANLATRQFTADLAHFVVTHVKRDKN